MITGTAMNNRLILLNSIILFIDALGLFSYTLNTLVSVSY